MDDFGATPMPPWIGKSRTAQTVSAESVVLRFLLEQRPKVRQTLLTRLRQIRQIALPRWKKPLKHQTDGEHMMILIDFNRLNYDNYGYDGSFTTYNYGYDGSLKENTRYKPVLRFKYEAIF